MISSATRNVIRPASRVALSLVVGSVAPTINGSPLPGEMLTSNRLGQWYLNGIPVSGELGSTFILPFTVQPGDQIHQAGSNVLTVADFVFSPLIHNGTAIEHSGSILTHGITII